MAEKRRPGLGRGLAALIEEANAPAAPTGGPGTIPIEMISPNAKQPRVYFDDEALTELAESIAEKGVLQPIVVRPTEGGRYEIVAGERRWRAAQIARLHEIPAIIKDFDDRETISVAIIENIQRRDLNPVEEAVAYRRLMVEFGHTQEEVAKVVHKSRSHIANLARLLDAPEAVRALVISGSLSLGHAKALLTARDPVALAEEAAAKGLSVREIEARAARADGARSGSSNARQSLARDPDISALERQLSDTIGLKVAIEHNKTQGKITIRYTALDQLDLVCQRLVGGRI